MSEASRGGGGTQRGQEAGVRKELLAGGGRLFSSLGLFQERKMTG